MPFNERYSYPDLGRDGRPTFSRNSLIVGMSSSMTKSFEAAKERREASRENDICTLSRRAFFIRSIDQKVRLMRIKCSRN
jgi:hypothetical protein